MQSSPQIIGFFDKPDVIILSHQRSGTHFLHASLASHPKIRGRGECFMRKLFDNKDAIHDQDWQNHANINRPNRLNIAIVMYSQVTIYERLCGSLIGSKIIHLLRDSASVAKSLIQMRANQSHYGADYKAHYAIEDNAPANVPFAVDQLTELKHKIDAMQSKYVRRLKDHPNALLVRFEEITCNVQVNAIPDNHAKTLLDFLGLEYFSLTNRLKKTGVAAQ